MSDKSSDQEARSRQGAARRYSPRAFLQSRRPERFSDSVFAEERTLDRQLLEYHLDTLTSRGQETDFERFAKGLAQREICPNLLPQTGPTGGGDSKVDSETYPVSDDLALSWVTGYEEGAASGRWAFAFSAKKDWRPKVRSDVAKIASTGRGYSKAFFVTNQFVPDRKRAEVEDKLSEAHGLDVRILDRTWILDRVFGGGHEDLAVTELGLQPQSARLRQLGPRDLERESELVEVERKIRDSIQSRSFGATVVDDALYAADLARGLDRPRHEVDGLYARADRLAVRYGTFRQQVEVAYQHAWTTYWWFEDEQGLLDQYAEVESRAQGSRNAYDFERLVNLWHLIFGAFSREADFADGLSEHTRLLTAELSRLKEETNRPSTSLQAEALLLQMKLAQRSASDTSVETILDGLRTVLERGRRLTGFPLSPMIQSVTQLGEVLADEAGYEELFETALEISSEQGADLSAAELLLERGRQQLDSEHPHEAIKTLGRSFSRLYNHEGRREAVYALYLCGAAYEQLGLLWAARGTLVTAASLAADEFWRYGSVTHFQAACYRRLKWIELQLGRLPHLLAWHNADVATRAALPDNDEDPESRSVKTRCSTLP